MSTNIENIEAVLNIYGINIKQSTEKYKDINTVFIEISEKFNKMEAVMPFFLRKLNQKFICKALAGRRGLDVK